MSSLQPTLSSKSSSNFNELQWVIQIRKTLEEELEEDGEIPVSIFNVPKSLLASDPESYTPQEVAIGPYHYWRPELYEMERYKVAAAKRTQKQLQTIKFQHLVDQLMRFEPSIRACYHKYLEFNGETLGWMMAIDASFFLEILQVYAVQDGKTLTRISSRMAHLVDHAGKKSAHHAILRDLVKLENQIPLFVLRKVLEFQFPTLKCSDEMLLSMFMGLCKELSPFKMNDEDLQKIQLSSCCHLLDFLYHMITPKLEAGPSEITEAEGGEATPHKGKSSNNSNFVKQFLEEVWKLLSKLNKGPIRLLKKILISGPVKVIFKLPWTILSNLPGFAILKKPLESLFSSQDKEAVKPEDENSSSGISKPPLIEEITIPSVSDLSKSGVKFLPTNSISSISFDAKTCSFYLPSTSLDGNTEVVLRNLVAYEASTASGPLVFTRYTELMNGIIDTEEDAKLLRDKGVILNRLKSDEEVAKLFNGMSKSIRLTKVPFLDKAIEDANKYYNGRWKVKMRKFFKTYVIGCWPVLALLAAILLLLLMTLQAFCSVYSCSRIFHINTTAT
ncbi:hypothetical protein RchiOBHm_Chr2g0134241 [Rosa chinensis]|uniref:Uncharacterized protein n=1 Tax=Rosa chinensis TaxID=74649 RepID=A0A2P6RVS8_ROSCH|nr:putative UPF0481 protein At3g02645 [Rosa chinensis]PRQ50528.1 hypothetical protein RchiOBHm_Chr2g0134241 [Rosa chinensis]